LSQLQKPSKDEPKCSIRTRFFCCSSSLQPSWLSWEAKWLS